MRPVTNYQAKSKRTNISQQNIKVFPYLMDNIHFELNGSNKNQKS